MKRTTSKRSMSTFAVGAITLAVLGVLTYLGFTKSIPFRSHFELNARFNTSNNIKKGSPVRIAGIDVGKVSKVKLVKKDGEPRETAEVTMRINKKGRPLHRDATVAIRSRIFTEGNFFMDVQPGSPSAPVLDDGDTIPVSQTSSPVQVDQILTTLQSDTRKDLRKLLSEYSTGISGAGGLGFNKSIQFWAPAYKNSAIVNTATLGLRNHDLSNYIRSAGRVAEALDRNPEQLKSLITDFNITARAFAREQANLEQTVAELPRTLRAGSTALFALNVAFPPVRRLVVDFRPGVRSTGPMIDATLPFIRQARRLVSRAELRGLVADARPLIPNLARLTRRSIPLYGQMRLASSCQNETILPWAEDRVPDPNFPTVGPVYQEQTKFLPGVAGESRSGDANGQYFRVLGAAGPSVYQFEKGMFGATNYPLKGANPPKPTRRPPLNRGVPCETQQTPDLRTVAAPPPPLVSGAPLDLGIVTQLTTNLTNFARDSLIREGFGLQLPAQGFPELTPLEALGVLRSENRVAIAGAGLNDPKKRAEMLRAAREELAKDPDGDLAAKWRSTFDPRYAGESLWELRDTKKDDKPESGDDAKRASAGGASEPKESVGG